MAAGLTGDELELVRRVGALDPRPQQGKIPLHRPLLLLWLLGRVAQGLPRLTSWSEASAAFEKLDASFGNGADPHGAVPPFWVLHKDLLWEIDSPERLTLTSGGRRPTRGSLDLVNPTAGLSPADYGILQGNPDLLAQLAALLLVKFFNPVPVNLLAATGLDKILTGSVESFLRPSVGERYSKRFAIWDAYQGQKYRGIGSLADGIVCVFSDENGPYDDRHLAETGLIEYRGDGLVGDQTLTQGNRRLQQCQEGREPIRYWHRPSGGAFSFESWVVIGERRLVWGIGKDGKRRREFAWILVEVPSPFRDSWPQSVQKYLAADDGKTHAETALPLAPVSPKSPPTPAEYGQLCNEVEKRTSSGKVGSKQAVVERHFRSPFARRAVLIRAQGNCESPRCTGQPQDLTDQSEAILEVDHVIPLSRGGADHPSNMIALCPNCHAVKTRGSTRTELEPELAVLAAKLHAVTVSSRFSLADLATGTLPTDRLH